MNDDSIIEQLDLPIKKIFLQTFMKLVCSDGKVEKARKHKKKIINLAEYI